MVVGRGWMLVGGRGVTMGQPQRGWFRLVPVGRPLQTRCGSRLGMCSEYGPSTPPGGGACHTGPATALIPPLPLPPPFSLPLDAPAWPAALYWRRRLQAVPPAVRQPQGAAGALRDRQPPYRKVQRDGAVRRGRTAQEALQGAVGCSRAPAWHKAQGGISVQRFGLRTCLSVVCKCAPWRQMEMST